MNIFSTVIKKTINKAKEKVQPKPIKADSEPVREETFDLSGFRDMFNWDYIYQNGDFGLSKYFRNGEHEWPNIHNGTDFTSRRSKIGHEVYAPFDFEFARVVIGEEHKGHGSQVHLYHEENFRLSISHMEPENIFIEHGQFVKKGTLIGLMGTRGNSTGKHFHIELVAAQCDRHNRPYLEGSPVLDNCLSRNSADTPMSPADIQHIYNTCKKTKDWDLVTISKDYEGNIRVPHSIDFIGKNRINKRFGKGHDLITKTYYNIYYFMNL